MDSSAVGAHRVTWRAIPGSIWALGFVSMFMDISSEMIHSLLPIFLVSVLGAGPVAPAHGRHASADSADLAPRVRIYPPTMDGYLIGELAQRSGMRRRALRRYEARGILPTPRRTASGYRVYPRESLELLSFIAGDRRLGLTLAEIRHIATGAKSPESTRGDNLG